MFDDAYICDCIVETSLKDVNSENISLFAYIYAVEVGLRFSIILSTYGGL